MEKKQEIDNQRPRSRADELEEHLIDFAVRIVKLSAKFAENSRWQAHCWTDSTVWNFTGAELRGSERRRKPC